MSESPFGNGSSGASGGGSGFQAMTGESVHQGPNIPQKEGPSGGNPDTIPDGGKWLGPVMDPPEPRVDPSLSSGPNPYTPFKNLKSGSGEGSSEG